jgi:hypothetical protein
VTVNEIAEARGRVFLIDGPESLKVLEDCLDAIFCSK